MIKENWPGSGIPYPQFQEPSADILQTFPAPEGSQQITFISHEVTALCPLTSQPDFYSVEVTYVPETLCIESKSAKLYLGSYRQYRGFIEEIALRMLNDWVSASYPQKVEIVLTMVPRGGISIIVRREYRKGD